jgi:hypothetical protein
VKRTWIIAGLLALGAGASAADAQIIDSRGGRGRMGPSAWTSIFAGWTRHEPLCDPDSNSCWNFGSALQWRGTVEYPMGNGATIGVVGTHSRAPLLYSSGPIGTTDADANISQILGQLRIGGGSGIHQVIDMTAGTSLYSNFRRTSDGARLDSGTVRNWSFALGLGFAMPFSPRSQMVLLQEFGYTIGKRMVGNPSNSAQTYTLRLGLRLGLGG